MANPLNSTAYRGPDGRLWVNVTEAKTLAIADSGYVQNVIYASSVISVPATATHGRWNIRFGGVPVSASGPTGATYGKSSMAVSPVAADQIQGGVDGTAVDNKDIILTAATARIGDFVVIQNTGETNGPLVVEIAGVWTREA